MYFDKGSTCIFLVCYDSGERESPLFNVNECDKELINQLNRSSRLCQENITTGTDGCSHVLEPLVSIDQITRGTFIFTSYISPHSAITHASFGLLLAPTATFSIFLTTKRPSPRTRCKRSRKKKILSHNNGKEDNKKFLIFR